MDFTLSKGILCGPDCRCDNGHGEGTFFGSFLSSIGYALAFNSASVHVTTHIVMVPKYCWLILAWVQSHNSQHSVVHVRHAGLGMSKPELERNPVLTETVVVDLNKSPKLPYDDNSFDFITNVVSVDYLTQPLSIFQCALLGLKLLA
jgi:hypothetical protein